MWKENKGAIAKKNKKTKNKKQKKKQKTKKNKTKKKKKIDPFKFSDQVENTKLIPSKYAYVGNLYPFVIVDNELFTFKHKTIRRKKK